MRLLGGGSTPILHAGGLGGGGSAKIGDIQSFEAVPNADWCLCDGRAIAYDAKLLPFLTVSDTVYSLAATAQYSVVGHVFALGKHYFALQDGGNAYISRWNAALTTQEFVVNVRNSALRGFNFHAGRFYLHYQQGYYDQVLGDPEGKTIAGAISPDGDAAVPMRIAAGNGRFAVASANGNVYSSVDLVSWVVVSQPANGSPIKEIAYVPKPDGTPQWIVFDSSGKMLSSVDLVNWTLLLDVGDFGLANPPISVAASPHGAVFSTSDGNGYPVILYTDGVSGLTMIDRMPNGSLSPRVFAAGDMLAYTLAQGNVDNRRRKSFDDRSWTRFLTSIPTNTMLTALGYGNGKYISCTGLNVYTSAETMRAPSIAKNKAGRNRYIKIK